MTEIIDGIDVTCIDAAVPMVIVPASAVGKSGHESKLQLDADAALIAQLEKIRIEAGRRMGLGDCSRLVIPKPVLIAPARHGGTIASRDFVPFNCHATYSVTGSIALSLACVAPGTVAYKVVYKVAQPPSVAGPGVIKIEHPGGIIEVGVRAHHTVDGLAVEEASLLRTCRKLFEGQICIPSRIWDGTQKAGNVADLARGV